MLSHHDLSFQVVSERLLQLAKQQSDEGLARSMRGECLKGFSMPEPSSKVGVKRSQEAQLVQLSGTP